MTLNITSKQMEITPAIREHVEERLAKLGKWQTQLISTEWIYCRSIYWHATGQFIGKCNLR